MNTKDNRVHWKVYEWVYCHIYRKVYKIYTFKYSDRRAGRYMKYCTILYTKVYTKYIQAWNTKVYHFVYKRWIEKVYKKYTIRKNSDPWKNIQKSIQNGTEEKGVANYI